MAREAISAASASAMTLSFGAEAPRVLQQSDQQEGEDACDGVDSHLPGLCVGPQRQADQPAHDDRHTEEEERRAADPLVGGLNETVEGRAPGTGSCCGTLDLLAHAGQPMLQRSGIVGHGETR